MMQFDMGVVWQRATGMVGANFQLLAVIAGVFLFLPALVVYLMIPDFASLMDPTADPEAMAAQMEDMIGPLFGWGLVSMVFQFVGYLAMVALIGRNRPTVGQAIAQGCRSLLTLFGALILFAIGYMVVAFTLLFVVGLLSAIVGSAVLTVISVLAVLVTILFLMARLSVIMPVIMLEDQLNPVNAMLRSWRLTAQQQWRILGFWVLLGAAYFVIAMLLFGIFSVIGATAGSSMVSGLILGVMNGLVGALVAMLISAIVVSMYQQLAGQSAAAISETFE